MKNGSNIIDVTSAVEENYRRYINPTLAKMFKFGGYNGVEWEARGAYVILSDGRKFLDLAGGYGVFSAGHSNPVIIKAVEEQLRRMPLSAKIFMNEPAGNLARMLAEIAPGELQFSFFCNSGTEAVEGALKLARLATGKSRIIAAINSFHGKTLGSLSASGRDLFKKPFEPLLPGFIHVPYGDTEALESAIDDDTAAVILEPIQGEGGIIIPPDDYFPAVREICSRRGILFIADEVQTGLGRTGRLFGINHWNVSPDIMTLGKALGGGVMPIGAFMGTPVAWKVFEKHPLIHTSTFGGGPMACAAGVAYINLLLKEKLHEKAAESGSYLLEKLEEVHKAFPDVIEKVRGKGLMAGVELVDVGLGGGLIMEMAKRGLIGVYTLNQPKVIRFEPPLNISRDLIDLAIEMFSGAVKKTRDALLM
ncbi:MAG: aminotransferase class III-fold pyridoxal phosphate-dependent enzyme [Candidatus Eremiobacteraeota bacterium]|nr:aminotransferase class III-fold pyridoxal phosphate-dependent enzyme [Candidatus Eremiobacteraeota bacterium]